MADDFSLSVIAKPTQSWLAERRRRVDRATMWGVRETARTAKAAARRKVRVYSGDRTDITPGLLRSSIRTSRKLGSDGAGSYWTHVGPFGFRARLYAGKIEDLDGYIRAAYDATLPRIESIHAKAWARAMSK